MPPAGPKPSGSGSPVKILLIVAAVLVVGGGAFLLLSGGGDEASADTPDGAVEAFFDAAGSGDCEALQELVVQNEDAGELAATCQSAGESGEGFPEMTLHDVSVVDQGDSSATVSVDYTMETFGAAAAPGQDPTTSVEDQRTTEEWTLQLQDGTWRVDIGAIGSGSSSSGGSADGSSSGDSSSSGGGSSSETTIGAGPAPPPPEVPTPGDGGGSSGGGGDQASFDCDMSFDETADLPPAVYQEFLEECIG